METKQRARPLPAEDRRQAIVEAVIPLIMEQGASVTTAAIAEAAGIAEGTIFRVFPDKGSLLVEALKTCFDPAPTLDQLARIEPGLPFEIKLRKAAAIIIRRAERVHAVAAMLRTLPPPERPTHEEAHKAAIEANSMILWGLTRMFDDERVKLAIEPARAAAAFRGLLHA
ncbi:MAG TPA: TetR family transcriptional regulator, partial [Acidimicrobiia bacterium]